MSLRQKVEALLPNWEQWYPSLFDAAEDLGIIKAQVCSPSQLLLTSRHSSVQSAAAQAHREQWGGTFQDGDGPSVPAKFSKPRPTATKRKRRRRKRRKPATTDDNG